MSLVQLSHSVTEHKNTLLRLVEEAITGDLAPAPLRSLLRRCGREDGCEPDLFEAHPPAVARKIQPLLLLRLLRP